MAAYSLPDQRRRWDATRSAEMWLGRYPGRVWMLALWCALSGANLAFAILFPANFKPPNAVTVGSCIYLFGVTTALLVMGRRTPWWFIHAVLIGSIAVAAALIEDAVTMLGAALFGWAFSMVAMYAAVWLPRRIALSYLAAIAISYLVMLGFRGDLPYMLVTWLLTVTTCAALVFLLLHLVENLRTYAVTDPLTGLMNRTGLEFLLNSRSEFDTPTTMAVIDFDDFKRINDTEGHLAGDRTLHRFGKVLNAALTPRDIAIRTGGDEFMVILPGRDPQTAQQIVDTLRADSGVAFSSGIVQWAPEEDFDSALARADALMYATKDDAAGSGADRDDES